jgi:hypothetical protein
MISGFVAVECRVDALCPRAHPMRGSDHLGRVTRYRTFAPLESWREAIAQSDPDLIVPCDDRAVLQLISLYDRTIRAEGAPTAMTRLIEKSLGQPQNYARLMARTDFIADARALGLRAPEMRLIENEADLTRALDDWPWPLVMKRDHSSGGSGVCIVKSREDALTAWRAWTSNPRWSAFKQALRSLDVKALAGIFEQPEAASISVQRFVAGHPATTVFAAWEGKLLSSVHFDVLVTERDRGPSCVVRRLHDKEMTEAAAKVAARYGMSGLHGLDYMRDGDGVAHLIEINPRATATCNLSFGPGHDALAALAQCISSEPVAARPSIPEEIVALFPNELVRNPASPFLETAYHDIPLADPGVARSLLQLARRERSRQAFRRAVKSALWFWRSNLSGTPASPDTRPLRDSA